MAEAFVPVNSVSLPSVPVQEHPPRGEYPTPTHTYFVVWQEGGNIRGIYPYAEQEEAEQEADRLWTVTDDQGQDDVRVYRYVEGAARRPDVRELDLVYLPEADDEPEDTDLGSDHTEGVLGDLDEQTRE
jgi:hypothetical protein